MTMMLISPAMAAEPFGSEWVAKPLVEAAPAAANPSAVLAQPGTQPAQPAVPALEEALKPAVPFIESVEARLMIKPKSGEALATRLNNLQQTLFGEIKYNDAGQLLAKLAELFPQEAAKARADLMAKMQKELPPAPSPAKTSQMAQQPPADGGPQAMVMQPAPPAKKKKGFFDDDWDDWDDDEFFNEDPAPRSSGVGSGLKAFGQGLAGLAAVAGTVAGSYYLNKKLGGNDNYIYRDPYSNYYYSPYGYQGMPYGTPYAYGPAYGRGVVPYYGAAPVPGYGVPTYPAPSTRRYSTSPLGVPSPGVYWY